MDLRSKFRGALLGTGVGDSLGRALEGGPRIGPAELREMLAHKRILRYTDDTQQMIGVAESLIEVGGFDGKHMARRFVENYDPSRGYGPGSSQVIRAIERGEPWDSPAKKLFGGSGSYGNGSSMRIAPIGLFYHDDLEELWSVAKASSRITHTHELGMEGAALQACAVGLAVRSDPSEELRRKKFLEKLQDFTGNKLYKEKLVRVGDLLTSDSGRSEVVRSLGNGIEAFNSVPTAFYSFLSHPDSFEDAVLYAVGLGGDADTIGAMTGAITGAYLDSKRIPNGWRKNLEDRDRIVELADRLHESKIS